MTITARLRGEGHNVAPAPCSKCYAEAETRAKADPSRTVQEWYEIVVIEVEEVA